MGSRRYSYALAGGALSAAIFSVFGYLLGRKADELAERAEIDGLTGLYNARGFDVRLAAEIARTLRYHAPLSLLVIDLDRLKDINDRHGHYAGQSALRDVAAAIRAELRASDVGARWGGDEFSVIAPNTSQGAAWVMAERIRHAIASAKTKWPVTGSIGLTTLDGSDSESDADAETLMRSADAALYEAKHRGRNRVAMARPLTRRDMKRADERIAKAPPDDPPETESTVPH